MAHVSHEAAAAAIEATGAYRVLRSVRPREIRPDHQLAPGEAVAVIVDVETTGLDHRQHEVIELGMVAFVHDANGRVGPVVGAVSQFRRAVDPDPPGDHPPDRHHRRHGRGPGARPRRGPRAARACQLGYRPPRDVRQAILRAARPAFRDKAWGCSMREVPWIDLGYEGARLGHLVMQGGLFHHGHRAVDDCHALLELLASSRDGADSALRHLLASAGQPRVRLWAERSPFDRKDVLRSRGYRWNNGDDGRARSWWTEIPEGAVDEEMRFLREEIYRRQVDLPQEIVTAHERYRAGP